jgi:hypothetical protein
MATDEQRLIVSLDMLIQKHEALSGVFSMNKPILWVVCIWKMPDQNGGMMMLAVHK